MTLEDKDMLDFFQRFCSFRRVVKVLPESGQCGTDMLIPVVLLQPARKLIAGGDSDWTNTACGACFYSLA